MTTIVTLSGTPIAASTIIDRALRIIEQISPGVLPTTDEYAAALVALNGLLDAWRNERLMCLATQDEPLTLVSGQPSYTVGFGGDLNTNRPVRIDRAYVIYQGVSFPVDIYTDAQFAAIPYKTQDGPFPTILYYAADMDSGHLWPWPVCNTTDVELHVVTWTSMISFATTATTAALAPGWQDALTFALAVMLAPEYQFPVTQDLREMAKNAKKGIQTVNSVTPISTFDGSLIGARYRNWRMG
jgi:hypothetical protein